VWYLIRKPKKQSVQRLTLMIVPDTAEKVFSFNLSVKTIKMALALLSCGFLLAGGTLTHYILNAQMSQRERSELTSLRKTTVELKIAEKRNQDHVEELAKSLSTLQKDMDNLKRVDHEIRQILANGTKKVALNEVNSSFSARTNSLGGPKVAAKAQDIENLINELKGKVTDQQESLTNLKETVVNKKAAENAMPSIWPAMGEVTSTFGWRSYPSGWHPGIDIANSIGTPIMATAAGVVSKSAYMSGYGNMVVIDHGYGMETLYGHNSRNIVRAGQTVEKGEVIAYMGNTGVSTGSHVHYEVRVNGTAVNPFGFL